MNDHDIQLLALGAAFGMNFMLCVQIAFGILDDRRDRKVARAAKAQLAAAQEKAGAFPISSHPYKGEGSLAPCTAEGYGTACGENEYDHTETP